MIPISIIVKLLKETGVIEIIGVWLSPAMEIVGLPGSYGLVWATALLTNIYGGLVVFFSLDPLYELTVAQVTVLAVILLLAHNLPVEIRIAQKAGVRVWFMLLLRIGGAFLLGYVVYMVCILGGFLQQPNTLTWSPSAADSSLLGWMLGELQTYGMIFVIIFGLLVLMRILQKTGVINRLNNLLAPMLRVIGMSKNAAPVTMIGMTLGLAYGGGLIIKEARSGLLTKKDVFLSLSFMGLSHSLIEDTLLMLAIGASIAGVLVARLVFTLLIMLIIITIIQRVSRERFTRLFTTI